MPQEIGELIVSQLGKWVPQEIGELIVSQLGKWGGTIAGYDEKRFPMAGPIFGTSIDMGGISSHHPQKSST